MNVWDEIKSLASTPVEHLLPILLLAVIFIIFLIACLFEWWRERHAVDLSIPPPVLTPKITVTDGKTGEERVLSQE